MYKPKQILENHRKQRGNKIIRYIFQFPNLTLITLGTIVLVILIISYSYFHNVPLIHKQYAAGTASLLPDQLFTPDSPWNQAIGTNVQLDSNSQAMVNAIASGSHIVTIFGFGMPLYVATASDPTYRIIPSSGDPTFNSLQPMHVPNTAAPAPGFGSDADHWMFIYDTTKNVIFEMWMTQKNGNNWVTNTGNVYSPTGDGVIPYGATSPSQVDGNGASYFGGVVRSVDIQRGYINHALSLVTPDTGKSHRYPLSNSDGQGSGPSAIPEGSRLQLDPNFDCGSMPGSSQGEAMICQALETYGGYVRDTGGGSGTNLTIYFEGEDLSDPNRKPPTNPGDAGRMGGVFGTVGLHDGTDLPHIPWNRLRVLQAWDSYVPITPTPPTLSPTSSPNTTTTDYLTAIDNNVGIIFIVILIILVVLGNV